MDPAFLAAAALFISAMSYTPGPNNTMALATGLGRGMAAAWPLCFGVAAGGDACLILAYFGLGELFGRFPALYAILRIAGSIYMLWLAWKISGLAARQTAVAVPAARPENAFRPMTFWQAFLFQVVNAKLWVLAVVAVSSHIGVGADRGVRFLVILAMFTAVGMSSILLWAAGGAAMRRFLSSAAMRRCNYAFASFLVLSVVLLFLPA